MSVSFNVPESINGLPVPTENIIKKGETMCNMIQATTGLPTVLSQLVTDYYGQSLITTEVKFAKGGRGMFVLNNGANEVAKIVFLPMIPAENRQNQVYIASKGVVFTRTDGEGKAFGIFSDFCANFCTSFGGRLFMTRPKDSALQISVMIDVISLMTRPVFSDSDKGSSQAAITLVHPEDQDKPKS